MTASHDKILILDFGSQTTQLIARRVREAGAYCEILPCVATAETLKTFGAKGVVLSGGPASVHEASGPRIPDVIFELGVPVLGICYGQQAMVAQLGGEVKFGGRHELGAAQLEVKEKHALLAGDGQVWMNHGDIVVKLPEGFKVLAGTEGSPYAAVADEGRKFYGVQFHPEVTHSVAVKGMLRAFVRDICGCKGDWSMAGYKAEAIAKIKAQVGAGKVLCGVSGGVDSTVVAALLAQAIGEQAICVHIDHGLNRANESANVIEALARAGTTVRLEDVSELFLGKLSGVVDPEQKRKIIGRTFIEVFERVALEYDDVQFLAQGTLYPDVIESMSAFGGPSATIKSHHNVGGLPEKMNLKLVEPLRLLFKDEVRALGRELGLPHALVARQPFPGPGLAVRIPDAPVEPWKLAMLRDADVIYQAELVAAKIEFAQAFAVFLSGKSVGLQGDGRVHAPVVALRAVATDDFMTATAVQLPWDFLMNVGRRIVNEVVGPNGQKFSRAVYDISSKPPGTIEWE